MKKVAFTSTIPQEYIWAANLLPLDLNNYFITNNPLEKIKKGEELGIPRNTCSWIKGLLGSLFYIKNKINTIIAVTEGDCSNNHGLINLYQYFFPEIPVLNFSFPGDKNPNKLKIELKKMSAHFEVNETIVNKTKQTLDRIRKKIREFDNIQSIKQNISAKTVQNTLVTSTDFNSDYSLYEQELDIKIQATKSNVAKKKTLRIGYTGVPTIINNLFDYIETNFDAKIVFFEVEQDFAMYTCPPDITEQYLNFQYPYSIFPRIERINKEISNRKLDGVIHYVQTFCHRQIDDTLIKKLVNLPILTIEGDSPASLDMRTKIRIESFLERLIDAKN